MILLALSYRYSDGEYQRSTGQLYWVVLRQRIVGLCGVEGVLLPRRNLCLEILEYAEGIWCTVICFLSSGS
jgi:hypothetical protein